jgi:hypothetical protein
MLPGGLDEGGNAFRSVERDHARIGIGLDGSLREHRRSSGDMADDLEMPEGVAQPVDGGRFLREHAGALLRRHQRDGIEEARGRARQRLVRRELLAAPGGDARDLRCHDREPRTFLLARSDSGVTAYFNFYVTQSVGVLKSAAYLGRLDEPTPMTRTVMSEIFKDMIRDGLPSHLPARRHARHRRGDRAVWRTPG